MTDPKCPTSPKDEEKAFRLFHNRCKKLGFASANHAIDRLEQLMCK